MSVGPIRSKQTAGFGLSARDPALRLVARQRLHGQVTSLAFDPDRRWLVSGDSEGALVLWDLRSGALRHRLPTRFSPAGSFAFLANGTVLATGGAEGAQLWDVETGRLQRVLLTAPEVPIHSVASNLEGSLLVAAGADGFVQIWDLHAEHEVARVSSGGYRPRSIALSSDGHTLAAISEGGDIAIRNLVAGQELDFSGRDVLSLNIGDRFIAAATGQGEVQLWERTSGDVKARYHAHSRSAEAVAFTPDGRIIVSAGRDGRVQLIDIATGLTTPLATDGAALLAIAVDPRGELVATGGKDGIVRLWSLERPREIGSLIDGGTAGWAVLTPELRFDAAPEATQHISWVSGIKAGPIGDVASQLHVPGLLAELVGHTGAPPRDTPQLLDLPRCPAAPPSHPTSDRVPRLVVSTKPAHQVSCIAFDPNGHLLASGGHDASIEIWNVASRRLLRTLRGHTGIVTALAFDSTGEILASGAKDGTARLWDPRTGHQLQALRAGDERNNVSVAFLPDEQLLMTACDPDAVRWWHIGVGAELRSFDLPSAGRLTLSDDGQRLVRRDSSGLELWDPMTGRLIAQITLPGDSISVTCFSPDRKMLAAGNKYSRAASPRKPGELSQSEGFALLLWDADTGAEIAAFQGHTAEVCALTFDPAGARVASADIEGAIAIWNCHTGERVHTLQAPSGKGQPVRVNSMAFHRDGELLAVAEGKGRWWGRIRLWNTSTGEQLDVIERNTGDVNTVAFDDASRRLAVGSEDGKVWLWPFTSGAAPSTLKGHDGRVFMLACSPDQRTLASASEDRTARLWDVASSTTRVVLDASLRLSAISVSPDGTRVATGGERGDLRLWDMTSGLALSVLRSGAVSARDVSEAEADSTVETGELFCLGFSPDGRVLAEAGTRTRLWDVTTGTVVHVMPTGPVWRLAFHPKRGIVATGGFDQIIRMWSVDTGQLADKLETTGHPGVIESGVALAFRNDGGVLASGGADGVLRLWDVDARAEIASVEAHASGITSVAFDASGDLLVSSSFDAGVVLWDVHIPASPRRICALYAFSDGRWAVIDAEGRFDASDAGDIPWLGWVVGMEPIALDQLKERYYEPRLLRKLLARGEHDLLGTGDEPLLDVPALSEVELYPAMELLPRDITDPHIRLRLTERGGGIGRVVVSINGKEISSDARGRGVDRDTAEHLIELDLSNNRLLRAGESNVCDIRVYNAEGYLVSRDLRAIYDAPTAPFEPPHLWAIVAGISAYRGNDLRLRFAADDAEKVARAITLGGARLFGEDHVHVKLLTAPAPLGRPDLLATRRNLAEAFESARTAQSTDVLVVFLAGHGTCHGLNGDYYYLTCDATTGDLDDPGVRSQTALSSEELTALLKRIPALKQVVILDTCASGAFEYRDSQPRELPSSVLRALEKVSDRTGTYILAGATADKRAYESSRYGQGLLTYSLLLGMRAGAALADGEYIDVNRLFEHAVQQVPKLALNVGGMQRPTWWAPKGGSSFLIGRFPAEDRADIPIARLLPIVLRAGLEDLDPPWGDTVGLAKLVNDELRALDQQLLFVDDLDNRMTDAYQLRARYRRTGDALQLDAHVLHGARSVAMFSRAIGADLDRGAQDIVAQFLAAIEAHQVPQ